jgi:hypothetical protein
LQVSKKGGLNMKSLLIIFAFPIFLFAQHDFIEKLDTAYMYAKKGVFWALENINFKKEKLENQLVSGDVMVARVKIKKMIDGFQIESTGYFDTYSAKVSLFRGSAYLIENGYLKNDTTKVNKVNNIKKKRKID